MSSPRKRRRASSGRVSPAAPVILHPPPAFADPDPKGCPRDAEKKPNKVLRVLKNFLFRRSQGCPDHSHAAALRDKEAGRGSAVDEDDDDGGDDDAENENPILGQCHENQNPTFYENQNPAAFHESQNPATVHFHDEGEVILRGNLPGDTGGKKATVADLCAEGGYIPLGWRGVGDGGEGVGGEGGCLDETRTVCTGGTERGGLVDSRCSEFLGCMSFGVKGILRKDVSGWFHLLTEDVGKEKHLQVSAAAAANGKPLPGLSKPPRTAHSIPQINKDVYGLKSVTLHMEKRKNGFGFSVIEECPARVGRVDLGSPAEEAGLKVGDYVIKVNCKNVSRSTVKGVKNLIVKSGNQLVLEIHRCHNNSAPEPENLPPPATGPEDKADSSQGCKVDHHIYESIADGSLSERSEVDKENKENEMAVDAQFEVSSVYQGFSRDPVYSSTPLLAAKFGKGQGQGQGGQGQGGQGQGGQGQGGPGHGGQGQGSQEEEWRRQEAVHHLLSLEVDFIDFMMLGIQRYSQPLRHQILTTRQHATVFQNVEQRYSQPLRHQILTTRQHATVFQNVEQLVDISWFHVQQIHMNAPSLYPESNDDSQASEDRHFYDFKASEDRHFASAVAMIYDSKVEMFCQAHEAYAAGLSAANCVLSEMGQNKKFLRLVKDPPLQPGQPSISAFIFRPLQHMKELSSVFQEIYKHTSSSSAEHATLRKVTQTLKDSVLTISNMSNARVQSLTSLSSHTRSSCSSSRDSCTTSSRASSRESISDQGRGDLGRGWVGMDGLRTAASVQTVRSVDRQVLAMQDRLVFTKDVPILMTLLSDVLILCQPDRDGNLHVLCHPIFLQHLASVHTLTNHRTELVFTLRSVGEEGGEAGPQTMVFRTPSPQDLSAWKCLLDQRIQRTLEESVIPMEVDLDPDSDHDPDSMVTTLGS
ncbi:hypothetical protein ACOMHN_023744 [Nucella lapillus]